jgi:hypothetical protein
MSASIDASRLAEKIQDFSVGFQREIDDCFLAGGAVTAAVGGRHGIPAFVAGCRDAD